MKQKISTDKLNRANAIVGIAGGLFYIGFAVWQVISMIKAQHEQRKLLACEKNEQETK